MLRFTKRFKFIAVFALVIFFIVPDILISAPHNAEAAAGISLSNVVLTTGKTKMISVEGDGTGFTWTSSNTAVAKVTKKVKADNSATITAKGEGVAVITATKGKNVYTCSVVVMHKVSTKAPEGEKATTSKGFKDITVFDSNGTVTITRSNKNLTAQKNMKLKNSDFAAVSSDKDSFLRLCVDDKSYTYFEPGSEFAISKGWFSKIKICMTKGEMIVEVQKKLDGDDSVTVVTPNTSMSIRGTVVAIKTVPEKKGQFTTYNYVLEGTAVVTTKDKKEVTLKAGDGWQTTTNKKGKIVDSKEADATHFDFENIDLKQLKGADGNKLVLTGVDLPDDTDDKNSADSGAGTDTEKQDNNGDTAENPDNTSSETSEEPVFERAVPAAIDYNPESVNIIDSKEDRANESFVVKEYDAFNVLRHKNETIESYGEGSGMSFTVTDTYYDSNSVIRLKRTERTTEMHIPVNNGAAGGNDKYDYNYTHSESRSLQEFYYNSKKVLIQERAVDDDYSTTIWYDDQGRLAEYLKTTASEDMVIEHYYMAYDQFGNSRKEE